jgi:hypothetical protein
VRQWGEFVTQDNMAECFFPALPPLKRSTWAVHLLCERAHLYQACGICFLAMAVMAGGDWPVWGLPKPASSGLGSGPCLLPTAFPWGWVGYFPLLEPSEGRGGGEVEGVPVAQPRAPS